MATDKVTTWKMLRRYINICEKEGWDELKEHYLLLIEERRAEALARKEEEARKLALSEPEPEVKKSNSKKVKKGADPDHDEEYYYKSRLGRCEPSKL